MQVFPGGAGRAIAAISSDTVPDRLDVTELLDIDVDQLALPLALVAHRRRLGLERVGPVKRCRRRSAIAATRASGPVRAVLRRRAAVIERRHPRRSDKMP